MTLSDFLEAERGRAKALAIDLGVPAELISQWRTGQRQVPAERCPAIERATNGAVRCEHMRPDIAWDVLRDTPAEAPAKAA